MKLNIFKNILVGGSLILFCSCSNMLEEKTYTFISGEDLVKKRKLRPAGRWCLQHAALLFRMG